MGYFINRLVDISLHDISCADIGCVENSCLDIGCIIAMHIGMGLYCRRELFLKQLIVRHVIRRHRYRNPMLAV